MASRQDIREAVYQQMKTAVDGLVPEAQVTHESTDETEVLPTLVYNDLYRQVPMNNNTGPKDTVVEANEIVAYIHSRTMEAQFSMTVRAEDELEKEAIYEALRRHFEQYTMPVADESDIQSDVYRVTVTDTTSDDNTEREPVARGDTVTVGVFFERLYERPVDAVDTIEQSVDTDDDNTVEFTNTIN